MAKKYKCRVEYLESDSTAYIDTGVSGANNNLKIEMGFSYSKFTAYGYFFSNYESETANVTRFCLNGTDTSWGLAYINTKSQDGAIYTSNFTKDTFHTFVLTKTSVSIDGSTRTNDNPPSGTENTKNIILFNRGAGTYYEKRDVGMRCYYFRIYDNELLVRDFIPVLDNSGRPAMYDQVSGQLFYNQGSGEFTYGRQIIPVEYLESSGAQYIDTGIKGKNNLHYKSKINFTTLSTSGSNGIGGEYLANASAYIGMVRANGHYTYLFNNTAVETTTTIYTNTDYEIDSVMNSGSQVLKVNGETISTGTLSGTFTSTRNIFLYAVCSTNDAADVYGSLKMYYCQIYDNDILVRDFIPCIDENLTPFMFDKVNGTVYLNAGTGQFKVGPNVEKAWGGKKLRRKLALALANLKKKRKFFCEVEYLETTNQQNNDTSTNNVAYIDTGIIPDNTTKLECRAQFTTLISGNSNEALFGTTGVNSSKPARMAFGFASVSPYTNFYMGLGIQNLTTSVTRDTVAHTFTIDASTSSWKIDDTTGTFSNPGEVVGDGPIYLFARNYAAYEYANKPTNARTYYCKIWQGGSLVRDMIPVLDWNYTPCMYDRVTEQLFYTEGTKQFSYGREIHYVDYLESTGTQYINTGLLSTASSTVDTEFSFTSMESGAANNVGVFGGRNATTTSTFTFFKIASATPQYFRFDYNGQPQVATASDMTWDTSSKYRFQYNGTNCITTNTTTGESTVLTRSPGSTFTQYPIYLFAVNTAGTIGQHLSVRIYYYKYSDGTNSVDMVPAIDENGVGYMLDRVSHTIYDNAGTGAFGYSGREVEYLQSDGARAILAGVTVDDTCGYDVKWMALNADDRIIMGTKGSGDSRWVLSGSNNPNVNLSWNGSYGSNGLGLNKIQTAQMNYLNDRKRILNDTPLLDITTTLSSAASTYNVGIFAGYWGATTISLYSTCRIYYAKITKGTELIRDFIPMVKDGSPCLYDKVGGEYYFGIGTGSFTRGKIVEPEYE